MKSLQAIKSRFSSLPNCAVAVKLRNDVKKKLKKKKFCLSVKTVEKRAT